MDGSTGLNWFDVLFGLTGGLAIFLFGMTQMTDALKAAIGEGLKGALAKLTPNRITGALTGATVTAVIQSSSVTTVLLVGFISAGLMTLQQSIGVILGANVGTTITAQVIAFKVTAYAPLLVTIGFGLVFVGRSEVRRQIGGIVMGLGLIFYGMGLMSGATAPLRDYEPFIAAMRGIENPLLGIAGGALFTALVQSSSATTGIVIMLASQGFITLEAGLAIALGANVGTCATALLASLGKPSAAKQVALAHTLFNLIGAALWVFFVPLLAALVREISPAYPAMEGPARLAAEVPRQIANGHTLFNVVNTLVFLPFTGQLARLVERIVPDRPEVEVRTQPKYLDDVYLETPALALDRLRLEIGHLGKLVGEAVDPGGALRSDPSRTRAENAAREAFEIYEAIIDWSRRLVRRLESREAIRALDQLMVVANHSLSMAETISTNATTLRWDWKGCRLEPSRETDRLLKRYYAVVKRSVKSAFDCVENSDPALAEAVIRMKPSIKRSADDILAHLSSRLAAEDPKRVELYRLEYKILEVYKRLYYFARRIARTVTEEPDELDEIQEEAA
jgi:phosphate:Na+ symporter